MASTKHDPHRHPYHWNDITVVESRVRALESLMIEKGLATPDVIDAVVSTFENDIGPMNGAKVIARAWTDPAYKALLLTDGTSAVDEMGFRGLQTEHVVAVENSEVEHHMVVCTLCSCYPWTLLGIPPHWFKAPQYRSRAVINPREVLAEFGVTLGPDTAVRVWDSSAEIRYLVLPQRPAGTEGWTAERLAGLVTRDAMIGTGLPLHPEQVG